MAEKENSKRQKRIAGWLHCFQALRLASESYYEIGGIVVCPSARQLGIGKSLIEHAILGSGE
ncbi:GNAT family N-acetyltransferase [Vibrio sp. S9_S30]|uniref:GNAT family N-acetyltransferase n=1 Tax=Vibrio sp. S9_S30 TaxID=2720226 RepID=UPI001681A2A4|nr:GNAT family N-acetyltransferase [Vibrio sp. S9_S30]